MSVTYIPRSEWTNTKNGRAGRALDVARVDGFAVHYPADGNVTLGRLSRAQVAAKLRAYRQVHLNKKWADIGYNYAIDQAGRIWFLTGDNVGAHANVVGNTRRIGVLFVVGNNEPISPEAIEAFRALRADKRRKFTKATLVQGHQQVPGNSTACPGAPLMALVRSGALSKAPGATTEPVELDRLAASSYPPVGPTRGDHITWLGERLVLHLEAAGIRVPYAVGPGPGWSDTDREAVRLFQLGQGWTGDDADGYVGPVTLQRLAAAPSAWPAKVNPAPVDEPEPEPAPETHYVVVAGDTLWAISKRTGVSLDDLKLWNAIEDADVIREGQLLAVVRPEVIPPICPAPTPEPEAPPVVVPTPEPFELVDERIVFWNLAGYNAAKGKATASKRIPDMAREILADAPDVIIAVEHSHAMLREMDAALPGFRRALLPGRSATQSNGAGREVYLRDAEYVIDHVERSTTPTELNGDDKPMLGVVYSPRDGGLPRAVVAAHNEYRKDGIDKATGLHADTVRVRQLRENLVFLVHRIADGHDVPYYNLALGVDSNSYTWALEEAVRMNWRSSFQLAGETSQGKYRTHNNWRTPFLEGGHFDLVLVRHYVEVLSAAQELNASRSDHHKITVVRKVRK
ncbi:peptidoglycan-binding protein [Aeromicrobium sp. Leaf291]|uniref:peptidoglycan-binding protein n=1 Tax=Aeromicrobium sp. Leaf291 TaxID=1736325 RepID=UPI0006F94066|nr:peptidoglycan-binding protein [Aeromicrobium sp. Leaf291]KQP81561.1 hypothetical protein ASF35_16150 [Aeromicrobium sp. Leaf291]